MHNFLNREKKSISEEVIVLHCSPTMAGLKTGSLFSCPVEDSKMLAEGIRSLNGHLVPRGIRLVPLRVTEQRALIYMYRPGRLKRDLSDRTAERILSERDYPVKQTEKCIVELVRRLNSEEAFPHEIGLFLGYPPEDVDDFIKNGAVGEKCIGMWKVYGDVETAKCKFAQYKKCTRLYCEAFQKYHSFDRLIVGLS